MILVACSAPTATQAAKADGAGAVPDMIQPGLYRETYTMLELSMTGVPPLGELSSPPPAEICRNAVRNRRFDEIRVGEAGVSCTQGANNISSGGRIDASAICTGPSGALDERHAKGSYTSNGYEAEFTITSNAGGRRAVMRMRMVGVRIGECTAGEW